MSTREEALERVRIAYGRLREAQDVVTIEQAFFAEVCKDAYRQGVNDREMSELTKESGDGYSRARIQQFRKGDPRKREVHPGQTRLDV